MVHRPSDSRLLVNLLNHEKEYSKQLASLLEHSQASLTSFSAYASACAPPNSQIIVAVAGAFYGADEALRGYAVAVDQWQQQLKALKEMEDGLGNIMRDREILVTRLIKASKSSKPPPREPIPNSGSSSTLSHAGKHEVQLGSKLAAAQTELQACEAHLANKERELEAFRTATIRSGLQARCQALADCGWTWGEMGKEGINALNLFEAPNGNGNPTPLPLLPTLKPLPNLSPEHLSSDHSSLAPSQSASQIGSSGYIGATSPQYTLTIPPAHSISDHTVPNGTIFRPRPRAEAVEEPGGSSAEEGDTRQDVQVVENERFLPSRKRKGPVLAHVRTITEAPHPSRHVHFPSSNSDTFLLRSPTEREFEKRGGSVSVRKGHGVFGSIAALFRGQRGSGSVDGDSPTKSTGGRWKTRTDKNLKKSHGADSSDEEDLRPRQHLGPSASVPVFLHEAEAGPGPSTSRMMKKRLKRGSVQAPAKGVVREGVENRGWMSENDGDTVRGRKGKLTRVVNTQEHDAEPSPRGIASTQPHYGDLSPSHSLKKPQQKMPNGGLPLATGTPNGAPLSRNSSMSKQSIMTAPATLRHRDVSTAMVTSSSKTHLSRRRSISLDHAAPIAGSSRTGPSVSSGSGKVLSGVGYPPIRSSGKTTLKRATEPGSNLMSIVEDVKKNRDMFAKQQEPERMLVLPKAPPPASELLALEEQKEREAKQTEENLRSIAAASTPSEPPTPTSAHTMISIPAEEEVNPVQPSIHNPPDRAHMSKPLRSALRATSRSPSPAGRTPLPPTAGSSKPQTPVKSPLIQANGSAHPTDVSAGDEDDTASISSYETVNDVLNDDKEDQEPPSPIAPLPPPREETTHPMNSDLSQSTSTQSTGSTVTEGSGTAPKRAKSVRMSLPPTFSATPPAIYDDSDGGHDKSGAGRYEPWSPPSSAPSPPPKRHSRAPPPHHDKSTVIPNGGPATKGGWSTRIPDSTTHQDVWQDSDAEDEEYGAAKRLLNKFTRRV
ncbi:hypothetical protein BXZ70DRAFT_1042691 [Cristinia sonorae]|uniref:Uncharacterized protein n=1 Tax=Cristinia sonorae TaxID=1940300 RepID=A0A8K0UX62_9AGAR|nr:hypothetical protein BXZ70DRAFT_1042691 [Cristinia sonorae]